MVIDEIGKMELFSQTFIQVVGKLLRQDRVTLFGTIPIQKGKPLSLVEEIRNRDDVRVFTVNIHTIIIFSSNFSFLFPFSLSIFSLFFLKQLCELIFI